MLQPSKDETPGSKGPKKGVTETNVHKGSTGLCVTRARRWKADGKEMKLNHKQ